MRFAWGEISKSIVPISGILWAEFTNALYKILNSSKLLFFFKKWLWN